MCLTKLQKRTPQGYGYKVYDKRPYVFLQYRGIFYRGIFESTKFSIGSWTTPAEFRPIGKAGSQINRQQIKTESGRYYDPGYHIYDNLQDAKHKLINKPRRVIVRVEYKPEDVICTGLEKLSKRFERPVNFTNRMAPVTVVRKLKLVKEVEND